MSSDLLLEVKNLKKYFRVSGGLFGVSKRFVHAVDGIDLYIKKGETTGLVGESGCGKTTAGRLILRLIDPTDGEIYFAGKNLLKLNRKEMRLLRKSMQIVFQDPQSSLDPRMNVKNIIGEPLKIMGVSGEQNSKKRFWSCWRKLD